MSKVEAHAIQKFEVHLLQIELSRVKSRQGPAASFSQRCIRFHMSDNLYTTEAKTKIWNKHILVDSLKFT
jgi:hypothetical protein